MARREQGGGGESGCPAGQKGGGSGRANVTGTFTGVATKTDGKIYENGSGYAEVRKRTNTDVELERITRSNIFEYTLTKSQNSIHVRSY